MRSLKWTILQSVLLLCILFCPFRFNLHLLAFVRYAGLFSLIAGALVASFAALALNAGFSASLKPEADGKLVQTGLYGIVRHPAYSGITLASLGFSLWMSDAARILLTAGLAVLFNAKTGVEEEYLAKIHPEYVDYINRVKKRFVPGIY